MMNNWPIQSNLNVIERSGTFVRPLHLFNYCTSPKPYIFSSFVQELLFFRYQDASLTEQHKITITMLCSTPHGADVGISISDVGSITPIWDKLGDGGPHIVKMGRY